MWIDVLWAGLRVAMWITHVGVKFCHGLLEKALSLERPHLGITRGLAERVGRKGFLLFVLISQGRKNHDSHRRDRI